MCPTRGGAQRTCSRPNGDEGRRPPFLASSSSFIVSLERFGRFGAHPRGSRSAVWIAAPGVMVAVDGRGFWVR